MALAVSNTIRFPKVVNGGTGLSKIYCNLIMLIFFIVCDLALTFVLHSVYGALSIAFLIYSCLFSLVGMVMFGM
jgi:hypothetical protein